MVNSTIKIYGPAYQRPQLERELIWATPGQRGFTDAFRQAMEVRSGSAPSGLGTGPNLPSMTSLLANQLASASGSGSGSGSGPGSQRSVTGAEIEAHRAMLRAHEEARQRNLELANMMSYMEKFGGGGGEGGAKAREDMLEAVCGGQDVLVRSVLFSVLSVVSFCVMHSPSLYLRSPHSISISCAYSANKC